jgi:class 3 adenylate cyclase
MQIPETRYARAGDIRIAYQQWGEGPPLIIIPAFISNIEICWEHELYRRTLEHMGKYLTNVMFDKRGMGLSDRFEEIPTLEQRIEDIIAVMDGVGWERAHVLGVSEGGVMAQLFAADFPERVERLVLINTLVPPRYRMRVRDYVRDGDPPLQTEKQVVDKFLRMAETWAEEPAYQVDFEMPSQVGNESFTRWVGRLQRFSASPKDFLKQFLSIVGLDAADAPERIAAPTLVMHVKGDRALHVAMGRLLADLISGSTYVEIDGEDHFSWIMPNWREVNDAFIEFITGTPATRTSTRQFGTVLFTDIVDSTRQSAAMGDSKWRGVLDGHDRTARGLIDQHSGRVVKSTGDGLLAVFDAPSQGVECGIRMCEALRGIGVQIRAGVHAGEIEVHEDGDISGIAVNLAARVEQQAADGELWTSSTVRDLMLGGSASFAERGEHQLKGIEGIWRLFSVSAA